MILLDTNLLIRMTRPLDPQCRRVPWPEFLRAGPVEAWSLATDAGQATPGQPAQATRGDHRR